MISEKKRHVCKTPSSSLSQTLQGWSDSTPMKKLSSELLIQVKFTSLIIDHNMESLENKIKNLQKLNLTVKIFQIKLGFNSYESAAGT